MQILHRFTGSIQRYSEELSDPDRYRAGRGLRITHFTYKPHWSFRRRPKAAEYQPNALPEWKEQTAPAALNIRGEELGDLETVTRHNHCVG